MALDPRIVRVEELHTSTDTRGCLREDGARANLAAPTPHRTLPRPVEPQLLKRKDRLTLTQRTSERHTQPGKHRQQRIQIALHARKRIQINHRQPPPIMRVTHLNLQGHAGLTPQGPRTRRQQHSTIRTHQRGTTPTPPNQPTDPPGPRQEGQHPHAQGSRTGENPQASSTGGTSTPHSRRQGDRPLCDRQLTGRDLKQGRQ